MQKWKVCKKLMAVILTLCMVLPLISNQYLVVRGKETGTGTTTSYMDVDDFTNWNEQGEVGKGNSFIPYFKF